MPLIDYTAPQTVSAYAGMVTEELAALLTAEAGKATEVRVPTIDAGKVRKEFSTQARAHDKTARFRVIESDGKLTNKLDGNGKTVKDADGNTVKVPANDSVTRFVITLGPKHKPRRGAGVDSDDAGVREFAPTPE